MNFDRRVDPKKVFEFLSKNYDSWSQVIHDNKDRQLMDNGEVKNVNPIYDYNLLELIEETVNRHPNFFPDWNDQGGNHGSKNEMEANVEESGDTGESGEHESKQELHEKVKGRNIKYPSKSFLKKTEMDYLRSRISNMMKPESEGFNLYDTKDEPGLNTYDPEDDHDEEYDLEEVEDDYYGGREHHIEVELKPECDIHEECDCDCDYDDELGEEYDFTFEYNDEGKLVPTFDGVKEYMKNPKIKELKSSKKKKKKPKAINFNPDNYDNCLFCDYEAVFGKPPKNLIAYYNNKLQQEEFKRNEIRKKLQNAKLKALKKQKDLRAHQKELLKEKQIIDSTKDNSKVNND